MQEHEREQIGHCQQGTMSESQRGKRRNTTTKTQTQPYGIAMVQADQVDDSVASAANNGKKICVIDSGLDLPHEDMGTNGGTVTGTNNSGTGNWYQEGGPHGTHVAGTIAALDNNIDALIAGKVSMTR